MNLKQFRIFILEPTLTTLGMGGEAATKLMLGTIAHESKGSYLDQITGPNDTELGPAIGLYQMEPSTHDDIYETFLTYKPRILKIVQEFRAPEPDVHTQLASNLAYATVMARLKYYRIPEALPDENDIEGLAQYWKTYYNTSLGKGTVASWLLDYNSLAKPALT